MLSRATFSKYVKDVLAHLYDPVYLQKHPLVKTLVSSDAATHGIRAQILRETVVEAIEQLQPDRRLSFGSKEWTAYRLLNHRYLEAMTPKEVADKLHISERHFYRQHREALDAVTSVLWDHYIHLSEKSAPADSLSDTVDEIGLADSAVRQMVEHSRRQRIDLSEIAIGLQHILQPLADRKGVKLEWNMAQVRSLWIDPAVLRQIILNVAVAMLESCGAGTLRFEAQRQEHQLLFGVECGGGASALHAPDFVVARHLVEEEGGEISFPDLAKRKSRAVITLPARTATVLLIDDDPNTVALYHRYLHGTDYRLVGVLSGQEGIQLAEALKPDVIVLDVMMPSQDGWQTLQSLRENVVTAETPIVICSVLDQAELALTAGATDLIQKPVSPQVLLDVLERWCPGSNSPATST
jgi:CheY-like chemotaxis protein